VPEQAPDPIEPTMGDLLATIISADHSRHERLPLRRIDEEKDSDGVGTRAIAAYLLPIEGLSSDEASEPVSPAEEVDKALVKSVRNKTLHGLLGDIVNYGAGRDLDEIDEVLVAPWTPEYYAEYKPS